MLLAVVIVAALWSLLRMFNKDDDDEDMMTSMPTTRPVATLESYDVYDEDAGEEGYADYVDDEEEGYEEEEEEGYDEEAEEEAYDDDDSMPSDVYSGAKFSSSLL